MSFSLGCEFLDSKDDVIFIFDLPASCTVPGISQVLKKYLLIKEQISGTKMNVISSFPWGDGWELAGFLQ